MGTKWMVTGSAGFIGSRLAQQLLATGADVVGVDCLTDAYDPTEKRQRLAPLLRHPRYSHLFIDLAESDLAEALADVGGVFHLAGRPGVRDSFSMYPLYVHDNINGTVNLLASAKRAPTVRRLVYASSSSVYGDAPLPLSEDMDPKPISPYGQTKLEAERLCIGATGPTLETIALRYFTVYGPGQRPDMALRRFAQAALEGSEIEVYGDGEQTRDFTYVDDIVDATRRAMDASASGLAINVGGGSRVTVRQALNIIATVTGRQLRIVERDAARGDVRHTFADLERASEHLNFKPAVPLAEGIAAEVRWLRERSVGATG